MTAPKWRVRTTAAQRRQQREEFAERKARLASAPSAATLRYREKNRVDNQRAKCREKVRKALGGTAIEPFTAVQIAHLKPEELAMLREEFRNRIGALTAEQRSRINDRWFLAVLSFSTDQLAVIASAPP